jgi:hypothetical protein
MMMMTSWLPLIIASGGMSSFRRTLDGGPYNIRPCLPLLSFSSLWVDLRRQTGLIILLGCMEDEEGGLRVEYVRTMVDRYSLSWPP